MKYKDNRFLKYQEKQRDGEYDQLANWQRATERKIRRKRDHKLRLFYLEHLLKEEIEKEWWECLKESDKSSIMSLYHHQAEMMKSPDQEMWSNTVWFDTWEEWKSHILSEYKPNQAAYREARLKKIGLKEA